MPAASRRPKPGRVRKNVELDQKKLTELKRALGARSETEAIGHAIDRALFAERIARHLDRLAAAGGVEEVFPDGALEEWRRASRGAPDA